MQNFIVADIETAPHPDAAANFKPFEYRIKAAKGDGLMGEVNKINNIVGKKAALSPVTGRILCIGVNEVMIYQQQELAALSLNFVDTELQKNLRSTEDLKAEGWEMKSDGSYQRWHFIYDDGGDEFKMISEFQSIVATAPRGTKLITFNGRGFDFPFLAFRAICNGLRLDVPNGRPYNGGDNHIDLMLLLHDLARLSSLDSYSFEKYPTNLDSWIKFFKIPIVKKSIANGEINLIELAINGQKDVIEEYSKGDVDATTELLRYCYPIMSSMLGSR